jgi:hypothetical protein
MLLANPHLAGFARRIDDIHQAAAMKRRVFRLGRPQDDAATVPERAFLRPQFTAVTGQLHARLLENLPPNGLEACLAVFDGALGQLQSGGGMLEYQESDGLAGHDEGNYFVEGWLRHFASAANVIRVVEN